MQSSKRKVTTIEIGVRVYEKASALAAITKGRPSVDRYVQALIENDWEEYNGRDGKHELAKEEGAK